MQWKLCVVSHTYLEMDDSADDGEETPVLSAVTQESRFNGALSQGNDPDEVRPPRPAVEAIFGQTPLYWMQKQLLLSEEMMRFDRFHCFDFEQIDWNRWIAERFFFWTGHRRSKQATACNRKPRDRP